jgi:hypothetical protein
MSDLTPMIIEKEVEKRELFLVMVPGANTNFDFVPRIGRDTMRYHFSLKEAFEVRSLYIEKLRDSAKRTSDEKKLAVLRSLAEGCRVVPYVEN